MGLFSKKEPCPICGEKIGGLLPTKIDGQSICKDCSSKIDVPKDVKKNFTINTFKTYLSYYEENQILRDKFTVSETIDFGFLDTTIVFDYTNKLFCMNKKLERTIFEGSNICSFRIDEDYNPLIDYSDGKLTNHNSAVPQAVNMVRFQLDEISRRSRQLDHQDQEDNRPFRDIQEPFKKFNLEISLDHPYWSTLKADMDGPTFSNDRPDADDYLNDYHRDVELMNRLANALVRII